MYANKNIISTEYILATHIFKSLQRLQNPSQQSKWKKDKINQYIITFMTREMKRKKKNAKLCNAICSICPPIIIIIPETTKSKKRN